MRNSSLRPMIRPESPGDRPYIRQINELAFGTSEEADLVEQLHRDAVVILSLVAQAEDDLVGHVLFSRMWIDSDGESTPAVALAPMAVLPEFQRRGVGSRLIETGLDELRRRGEQTVIVVGHPAYYPRFGFSMVAAMGLDSPFSREAFMALELVSMTRRLVGTVRYPRAFGL